MNSEALIIDGVRTPRGKGRPSGALHEVHPQQLLGQTLIALSRQVAFAVDDVEDVVMGNGSNTGEHANDVARLALLTAGWPIGVPGVTLNRFCGSGQQAVMFAAMGITAGWQDLVVAGGVESMSRYDRNSVTPIHAHNAALRARHPLVPQGISADLIATLEDFSRADLDGFAVESQRRAGQAQQEGRFARSLFPVTADDGRVLLDRDEHPRPDTDLAALRALEPAFEKAGAKPRDPDGTSYDEACRRVYPDAGEIQHVHHAGNSSGIVDGAAAVLLASPRYASAHGLKARARVVAGAVAATEPVIMLTAPGPAALQCLQRVGMTINDVDLWEINEAFAAIPMKVMRDLELDEHRVNVNGGAIALGHPIGATGAILIQTVLDELEARDLTTGMVAMCTGGGMGTATLIERI